MCSKREGKACSKDGHARLTCWDVRRAQGDQGPDEAGNSTQEEAAYVLDGVSVEVRQGSSRLQQAAYQLTLGCVCSCAADQGQAAGSWASIRAPCLCTMRLQKY